MALIKNIFRTLAEYFSFVIGLIFIFVIGILYAFLHNEGVLVNIIFLIIAIGWMVYLIKSFWDIMGKKNSGSEDDDIPINIEADEHDDNQPNNVQGVNK